MPCAVSPTLSESPAVSKPVTLALQTTEVARRAAMLSARFATVKMNVEAMQRHYWLVRFTPRKLKSR